MIRQAFLHVDIIGPHVAEGHYDLIGPNGEIILPQVWETMIEPDWAVTMHMWPMPEPPKPPPPGPQPNHHFQDGGRPGSRQKGTGRPHPPSMPPPNHRGGPHPPPGPSNWRGGGGESRPPPPPPSSIRPDSPSVIVVPQKKSSKKSSAGGVLGWMAGSAGPSKKPSGKGSSLTFSQDDHS